MVNPMVERATSSMLIGPDWAMNIEICDTLNRDPSQSKAVVKGIKKRLRSKNPKVQLLTLTLLETIVKNCGDIVHMHVADKGVLHDMVKIGKKKSDFHVKEKILILIDTWQEAFGGPRARYPPFYAAYQELLRAGAVFPQRTESSAPVFTPPQTQPLTSYPQNIRTPENRQEVAESSAEAEFPTLSLSEIQNARGIMDVLAEMLNAIDPGNKEGLRQEVIVDLVEQCRTYKQRVVHLVNSTSDEALLSQGLALNDDLQRLLAKHETIASGSSIRTEKSKPQPVQPLVNVDAPLIDAGDSKQANGGSASKSNAGVQLLLPAPTNGPSTTPAKVDPKIDLLSGDDFNLPMADNTLAVVPVGQPQSSIPVSDQQNALALVDMFSPNDNKQPVPLIGQYPSTAQYQQQQQNLQPENNTVHPNGFDANTLAPQYQQSSYPQGVNPSWNRQMSHLHQPASLAYGPQSSSLPAPPWEAEATASSQLEGNQYHHPAQNGMPQVPQSMGNNQVVGMYTNQPLGFHPQAMQGGQPIGIYPPQMQSGHMAFMYPHQMHSNQMAGYGYGYSQQQNAQFIDPRMSGLSVRDDAVLKNSSYQLSAPSYAPSGKPSKPEDKLFGDLVDIAKFKPTKSNGSAGGM